MSENKIVELAKEQALVLDCGKSLKSIKTAYTTYGKLNAAKDNAILICHALTGDQYVASNHQLQKKRDGGHILLVLKNQLIQINFL